MRFVGRGSPKSDSSHPDNREVVLVAVQVCNALAGFVHRFSFRAAVLADEADSMRHVVVPLSVVVGGVAGPLEDSLSVLLSLVEVALVDVSVGQDQLSLSVALALFPVAFVGLIIRLEVDAVAFELSVPELPLEVAAARPVQSAWGY